LLTSILVYPDLGMSANPLFKRIGNAHELAWSRLGKTRVRIPLGSITDVRP